MDFSKINELKPYDLNCNIFDVYSYGGLSMQELLCQFFTKINECVETSNDTIDLVEWLVNEGLKQEVALKLTTWLNDGTLENLINVTLFENLNKKIDNASSQLEQNTKELKDITFNCITVNTNNIGDESDLIQNAIDYISSQGGGTVKLANKTYNLTKSIYLKSNVALTGETKTNSIINICDDEVHIFADDCSNTTISNFTLNCNNYKSRIDVTAHTKDVKNIRIENICIYNGGNKEKNLGTNNIQIKRFKQFCIEDIVLNKLYCDGAYGDGTGWGDNLAFASHGSDGHGYMRNIVISDCILKNTGRQNISFSGENDIYKPTDIVINNCILENSTMGGIDLEECDKITISNCIFKKSGKYTEYYLNGQHFAERYPKSIMRSGLSLHGDNNCNITNCIFDNCYYGIGGYGNGVNISNCKFINSKVSNGDLSSAGRWNFSNCQFSSTNIDYCIEIYRGNVKFNGCSFLGDTTSKYFVKQTSELNLFNKNEFINCDFSTNSTNMNGIFITYGHGIIKNCVFQNIFKVINCTSSSTLTNILIDNSIFYNSHLIVDAGYNSVNKINISNNTTYNLSNLMNVNTRIGDIIVKNNEFNIKLEGASDGGFVNMNSGCGFASFVCTDNIFKNINKLNTICLKLNVRDSEKVTNEVKIINNSFSNFDNAISTNLYPGSAKTLIGFIKNNTSINCTNFTDDNIFNTTKYIKSDNLEN